MQLNLPFSKTTSRGWQNLALLAIGVFYLAQFGADLRWHNMCGHLAIDYCAFWSVGKTATQRGYAAAYDLEVIAPLQQSLCPHPDSSANVCETIPAPYLPIFLLPFQLLSFLSPPLGYWFWTVLNLGVFYSYLRFFARETTSSSPPRRLLTMVFLSWPVFLSFFSGQVNIWLTIFLGEYMRATIAGKPFRAGLWLGGLLIKPQSLVLLVLALLIQRATRVLLGLGLSSSILLVLSYVMAGTTGLLRLLQLLLGFVRGIAATGPSVMMNWRMVGLFFSSVLNPYLVWILVGIGMLGTAVLGIVVFHRNIYSDPTSFSLALLGILAATNAVAWHSHVATATILICPLIYLSQPTNRLPRNTMEAWVLLPPAFGFCVMLLTGLLQASTLQRSLAGSLNFLWAIAPFALNLWLLGLVFQAQRAQGIRPSGAPELAS